MQKARRGFRPGFLYQPWKGMTLGKKVGGVIHFWPDQLIREARDERSDLCSGRL